VYMMRRRLSWWLGVGTENREGNAHVNERYLHVTCGSPLIKGEQRGDLGGGGQPSREYADVTLTYVDLIGPGELVKNIRRFFL
jgi:hypothetical protein